MSQKKNYSRYFIILQEEEKGYAISADKLPSGYVKMETKNGKCKVSYYAQNLKRQSTPYYMMLICNKKEIKKTVKLGELNIDDHGRADIMFEFPSENLAGTGISMDKVSGAAIVKFLDTNIIPVMTGFSTTEIPEWKAFVLVEPMDRISEQVEQKEEKESIFDKYEASIEASKENEQDKREEAPITKLTENIVEEKEKVEEKQKVEEKEKVEERISIEEKQGKEEHIGVEDFKQQQDELEYPRGMVGDFFNMIIEGYEEMNNFCRDIKRCKWHKIPINKIEDMYDDNYNKHVVIYFPMVNYYPYIKKHGHYLMGLKCNKAGKVKYLIYGIPGTKNREDQPLEGRSGFVTWVPAKDGEESGMGYWLMFYDFKSSTVLIPINKGR